MDPDRDRVLGNWVRQVALPRRLHQGHRRQGLDREDQEGVLMPTGQQCKIMNKDRNTVVVQAMSMWYLSELVTSLFEITQSLFALERTLISGANAQLKKKSEEQRAK